MPSRTRPASPWTHLKGSYQDTSHKPELIYALTRFEGMADFRDVEKTAAILRLLGLPWLDEVAVDLQLTRTPFQTLRGVVTTMLGLSGRTPKARFAELSGAARTGEQGESIRVFAQTRALVEQYTKMPACWLRCC
jgi:mannose-6-phosphate isomerase